MTLNAKLKIIFLITLGIFFTLSPIFSSNLIFNARYNKVNSKSSYHFNLDNENLKLSAVSEKIHIDNNWTAAKAAGICTGSGTYSDPYIIKDLEIDGEGSNSSILIENSAVYFKIENCSLSHSFHGGIRLLNVNNSRLIYNNCSGNIGGICLYNCNNNTISGNTVHNNDGGGIFLDNSNNNTISGNTANNNDQYGIYFNECDDNILSGNILNNSFYGIALDYSDYNNIDYNNISGKIVDYTSRGISLSNSNNNTLSGNTADNNRYGINLFVSSDNKLLGLYLDDNYIGISLTISDTNSLSGNTVTNNQYGIFLSSSNNNTHLKNIVNYNYVGGIILDENSCGNLIYLNCFNENSYLNAKDDGLNNHWDNGIKGNYWANYQGSDGDGNGIGDTPYNILGSAGSQDNFPLMKCPSSTSQDGGGIPIELIILISIISGGALIGAAALLLIVYKRKRIQ